MLRRREMPDQLAEGDPLLCRYSVRRRDVLGQGADGSVVRGVERETGCWHALKYLSRYGYCPAREVQVLQKVQHPNVVKLIQAFPPAGSRQQWVLAMPEADFTLQEFTARSRGTGRLTGALAEDLAWQILSGIHAIHEAGFMHRDLKPGNVLVSVCPQGEFPAASQGGLRACICDFSRARPAPPRRRLRSKTESNLWCRKAMVTMTARVGTTPYAAPEIAVGGNPGDEEGPWGSIQAGTGADIWSWGTIAFELFVHERFIPENTLEDYCRALQCRIGPPPENVANLGGFSCCTAGGKRQVVRPLNDYDFPRWSEELRPGVVFAWRGLERPSSARLLRTGGDQARRRWPGGVLSEAQARPGAAQEAKRPRRAPAAPQGERACIALIEARSVELPVRIATEMCACSGHCYSAGHRYRSARGLPPCTSTTLVCGSALCRSCCCEVPACGRPRLRGPLCSAHARLLNSCALELQLVRSSRRAAVHMLPVDMVDFVGLFQHWHSELLVILTLAMLKERHATKAWLASGAPAALRMPQAPAAPQGDVSPAPEGASVAQRFRDSLLDALRGREDPQNSSELRELYRGGTGLHSSSPACGVCGCACPPCVWGRGGGSCELWEAFSPYMRARKRGHP